MKKMLLTLPERLVVEVKKTSSSKTKSGAVVTALEEYLKAKKADRLLARFGKGFGLSPSDLKRLREAE